MSSEDKLGAQFEKAAELATPWILKNFTLFFCMPWIFCVRYHFGEVYIIKHIPQYIVGLIILGIFAWKPLNPYFPEHHGGIYILLPIAIYSLLSMLLNYIIAIHLGMIKKPIAWSSDSPGIEIYDSKKINHSRARWSEPLPPLILSILASTIFGMEPVAYWLTTTGACLFLHHTGAYYKTYYENLATRDAMIEDGELRSQQDLDVLKWLMKEISVPGSNETSIPLTVQQIERQPNDRVKNLLRQLQARYRVNSDVTVPETIEELPDAPEPLTQTQPKALPEPQATIPLNIPTNYQDLSILPPRSE